jgi:hypothetical protein
LFQSHINLLNIDKSLLIKSIIKFDNGVQNLDQLLKEKFWYHAKNESNELNLRLNSKEHIKNGIGEIEDASKSLLHNIEV